MDLNVIWGVIFMAFVVPYFFWSISREQTLEMRKKLYPGRQDEQRFDKCSTRYGLLWIAGICFLTFAWWRGWHPVGTLIILAGAASLAGGSMWLSGKYEIFKSRSFRFWVIGSGTWNLAVASWYLIFFDDTQLENYQFILLGVLPSFVAAVGLVGFRWANADPRT